MVEIFRLLIVLGVLPLEIRFINHRLAVRLDVMLLSTDRPLVRNHEFLNPLFAFSLVASLTHDDSLDCVLPVKGVFDPELLALPATLRVEASRGVEEWLIEARIPHILLRSASDKATCSCKLSVNA